MRSEVSKSVTKRSAATPLAKRTLLAITAMLTSARSPVSAEASTELLRKVAVGQLKAVAGHDIELSSATALSSLSGPVVALRSPPLATKDRSTCRLRKWLYSVGEFGGAGRSGGAGGSGGGRGASCSDGGNGGDGVACCKRRVPLVVGAGSMG